MSRKSADQPRRIYCRNGVTHMLYNGKVYGTKEKSRLSLAHEVKVEKVTDDGHVVLLQRKAHQKGVREEWGTIQVPRNERGS